MIACVSQRSQQCETVTVWKVDVEQQRVISRRGEVRTAKPAVGKRVDDVTVFAQAAHE